MAIYNMSILIPCFELSTNFILSAMIEMYMKINIPQISASITPVEFKMPVLINPFGVSVNIFGCVPTPWDNVIFAMAAELKGPAIAAEFGITLPVPKVSLTGGLKEVELDLALYTHANLNVIIPNYAAAEALVAAMLGPSSSGGKSAMTGLLMGTISPDSLVKTPPSVDFSELVPYNPSSSSSDYIEEFSSSSSSITSIDVTANTLYLLDTILSGGNMNLDDFTYEWSVISAPALSTVSYDELYNELTPTQWNIATILNFDMSGSYTLMLTFTSKTFTSVRVTEKLYVTVV